MSIGLQAKRAYCEALRMVGLTVSVHKEFTTARSTSAEYRCLKGFNKIKNLTCFQFPERIDLQPNDVIQILNSNDYWKVIDAEDEIITDVLVSVKAYVVKIDKTGNEMFPDNRGQAIFNAPIIGGVQVGGSRNTQTFQFQITNDIDRTIVSLIELIAASSLSPLHKEDSIEALNRLQDLSKKDKNDEVVSRVKSRLDLLNSTVQLSSELAQIATPLLLALSKITGSN
jgi:hypothetical protein